MKWARPVVIPRREPATGWPPEVHRRAEFGWVQASSATADPSGTLEATWFRSSPGGLWLPFGRSPVQLGAPLAAFLWPMQLDGVDALSAGSVSRPRSPTAVPRLATAPLAAVVAPSVAPADVVDRATAPEEGAESRATTSSGRREPTLRPLLSRLCSRAAVAIGLGRRLPRRLVQLHLGLVLYALSMGMLVRAGLGVRPWDVLHQGLARHLPMSFGTANLAVGALVLLAWVPLRERPGVGTIANVVVLGLVIDPVLRVVEVPVAPAGRLLFLALGVILNAVATAAYIGARLGAGPRDGLMTGVVARTGLPTRWVRTAIEVSLVSVGWLLGGTVGIGTLLYAVALGPLVHPLLPLFEVPGAKVANPADAREPELVEAAPSMA